ncbi:MAG: hypothetical protein HZA52_11080 [Planctomycetes bacterium]|nr:hypothetical protein [Planctomycetota bacterium]
MSATRRLRERVTAAIGRSALVTVDQALVSGSNLLVTVLLVRTLGLAEFGRFSLWWMAVVFAQSLQQACIGTPMLTIGPKEERRDGAEYYAAVARLEVAFLALVAVLGGALALPLASATGLHLEGWGELAALLAVAVARNAHDFLRQSGFARGRKAWVLALDALAYGGQLVLLLALAASDGLTTTTALCALAASSAFGVAFGAATFGAFRAAPGAVARALRRHARMSRWLAALSVAQWFTSNAYAAAAGVVLGPAAVAVLKAGQTILGVLHVLMLAVENVVPVRAAGIAARGAWDELDRYLARLARLGGAATVAVSALVALCAAPLSRWVYGFESAEQTLVIRGFALLYPCLFAIALLGIRLRTHERTRPIFVAQLLGASVSLVAASSMVEVFGLIGALTGIVLQQVLVLLVLLYAQPSSSRASVGTAQVT